MCLFFDILSKLESHFKLPTTKKKFRLCEVVFKIEQFTVIYFVWISEGPTLVNRGCGLGRGSGAPVSSRFVCLPVCR